MSKITAVVATAFAAVMLVPATSLAGGFATVGLSSLPEDARPGQPWVVELTVLQHGRTPLDGVEPRVLVAPAGGGGERAFEARPTGDPGVYRARVAFPSEGGWTYSVDDGFSAVHEFGTVNVTADAPAAAPAEPLAGEPAQAAGDSSGADLGAALALAALAGLLAAAFVAWRGRRERPAATGA